MSVCLSVSNSVCLSVGLSVGRAGWVGRSFGLSVGYLVFHYVSLSVCQSVSP